MVKKKNFLRVLTPTEVEVNNPFDQALHHKEEVGVEGELLCSTVNTTTNNGGYYRQQKPTSSLGKIYTKSGTMFQHSSRTSSVPSSSTYSSCDKRIVFIKNPTKLRLAGRLQHFFTNWEKLTRDSNILSIVQRYKIPFQLNRYKRRYHNQQS